MGSTTTLSEKDNSWQNCKNILIIRADNLGDLVMSAPAIRAVKNTFAAKITVLTSKMATGIAKYIEEIDEVITYDLPWVKTDDVIAAETFFDVVQIIKGKKFDAAIIFTVFSQNPLPAAMLAYLANIPKRLAYCRENPYHLLTNWFPDKEPYDYILHQVERDIKLVNTIGAYTGDDHLRLTISNHAYATASAKMEEKGIDTVARWLIFHPGVSEEKRKYPADSWIEVGKRLTNEGYQIIITGTANESALAESIATGIGEKAFAVTGLFNLEEFIAVIRHAPIVVSVNTGTVHIAAAVETPIVVLYANTNPQHTPWKVPNKVLYFDVDKNLRSKNEVLAHLYKTIYKDDVGIPPADDVVAACFELLNEVNRRTLTATSTSVPATN